MMLYTRKQASEDIQDPLYAQEIQWFTTEQVLYLPFTGRIAQVNK